MYHDVSTLTSPARNQISSEREKSWERESGMLDGCARRARASCHRGRIGSLASRRCHVRALTFWPTPSGFFVLSCDCLNNSSAFCARAFFCTSRWYSTRLTAPLGKRFVDAGA